MGTFGEELKRLADQKGLDTQKKLAVAAGVSQQMIAMLYLDKRPNVSAVIVYKLCDALGVDCTHFRPFLSAAEDAADPAPEKPASAKKGKTKGKAAGAGKTAGTTGRGAKG